MAGSRVAVKQAQKRKRNKTSLIVALVIILAGVGVGGCWFIRLSDYKKILPGEVSFPEASEGYDQEILDVRQAFSKNIINILLLGFDRDEDRDKEYVAFRADTIMLASINLETGRADLVSVPRDSLVPIYNRGGGRDKINSAFVYGWSYGGGKTDEEKHQKGMLYQVETVSMALGGIPIHYYVTLDMDAVVQIVDAVGGVEFDVPKDIYHKNGRIIAPKGLQVFSGRRFLDYVRNRNYRDGDLQRVKNQQAALLALFKQVKSLGSIIRIPKIYKSVVNNTDTNLSLEQIMSLAHYATQTMDTENISTHVLKTSFAWGRLSESWTKSYSYLIIDQKARAKLLNELWGLEITPGPTDVLYPPLPDEPEPTDEDDEDEDIPPEEVEPDPNPDPEPDPDPDPQPDPDPDPDPDPEPDPEPDPDPEPSPQP